MPREAATEPPANTPLAPSVEKAYYRKCIQLKRRLNEVEAANDDARVRRARLDRALMKMRLERAFLLDELRKRMEYNIDGSEASGEEGIATPPPDRPHRDKRRRPQATPSAVLAPAPPTNFPPQTYTPPAQRAGLDLSAAPPPGPVSSVPGPDGRVIQTQAISQDGHYLYMDANSNVGAIAPPALPHGSPYGPPPTGLPSVPGHVNGTSADEAHERESRPVSRETGATVEPLGVSIASNEENGERKLLPSGEDSANSERS